MVAYIGGRRTHQPKPCSVSSAGVVLPDVRSLFLPSQGQPWPIVQIQDPPLNPANRFRTKTTSPTRSQSGSAPGLRLYSWQRVQSQALSLSTATSTTVLGKQVAADIALLAPVSPTLSSAWLRTTLLLSWLFRTPSAEALTVQVWPAR